MAITQPGDTTVISPLSVPNDAGPAMRAESVLGGFIALPSGSGPPTTSSIPLVMRRVGAMAYTPADGKFWQLRGGTADANWIQIVGLATTAVLALSAIYVDQATGSDTNSGAFGSPLASLDELRARLCPNMAPFRPTQNVAIYIAAGTYPSLELSVAITYGSGYTFDIFGAYTSSSPITLATVTDTVPHPTSPVRGRVTTASGTFAAGDRLRATSGANTGAISYVTGVTSSTDAWVKRWFLEDLSGAGVVSVAAGTTVVKDTLTVTINRVRIVNIGGSPIGGPLRIYDTILPRGLEWVNTLAGSSSIYISRCIVGNLADDSCRVAGNSQLRNCKIIGPNPPGAITVGVSVSVPDTVVLSGCLIQCRVTCTGQPIFTPGGNCFNGGSLLIGTLNNSGQAIARSSSALLSETEWTDSVTSIPAVFVGPKGSISIDGQQYGFGTQASVGYQLTSGAKGVTTSVSLLSIPATQQLDLTGHAHAYADVPLTYDRADCSFTLLSDPSAVIVGQSFRNTLYIDPTFTRTSNGSQSAPYPSITAELAAAPSTGAVGVLAPNTVTTENVTFPTTGTWEVRCEAEAASFISGNIVCSGAISEAISITNLAVTGSVTGVAATGGTRYLILANSDVNGAVGLTATGSGVWTLIANGLGASSSGLNGACKSTTSVTGSIQASNYSFTGAISHTTASQLTGCRLLSGSIGVGGSLLIENTTFAAAPTFTGSAVVTMDGFSHASAIAAGGITLAGGATLVLLNSVNPSGIQQNGATSGQVLTWNGSTWAPTAPTVTAGVSSFKTRTGAVVPATSDYIASQIDNDSGVSGLRVKDALNNLSAADKIEYKQIRSASGSVSLTLLDASGIIQLSSTSTVTIPLESSVAFTAGTTITFFQDSGSVTFSPSGGVTIKSALPLVNLTNAEYVLTYLGLDVWRLDEPAYRDDQIQNTSTVSGTYVKNALTNLNSSIASLVTGVSSYNSRSGAVVPASGDYTSTQVTNSSSVSGSTVTAALNSLSGQISGLTTAQIANASTVISGTTAKDVDEALLREFPVGAIDFNTPGAITLSLSNLGKIHRLNAVGTFTLEIDNLATAGIPVGASYTIFQYAPGSKLALNPIGVSLLGNVILTQLPFSKYVLTHVATNVWRVETRPDISSSRYYPTILGVYGSNWSFISGVGVVSTHTGGSGLIRIPIGPFAANDIISGVGVTILPGGGHGALPSPLPQLRVYNGPYSNSPAAAIATVNDSSASVPAYESVHSILATFTPVSATGSWWIEFEDELNLGMVLIDLFAIVA